MSLPDVVIREASQLMTNTQHGCRLEMALKQYAANSIICMLESIADENDEENIHQLWQQYSKVYGSDFIYAELAQSVRLAIEQAYKGDITQADDVLEKLGVKGIH